MVVLEFLLVYVLSLLAGGWAIPAGILFEMNPFAVYLGAVLGGLTWLVLGLTVGARGRDWVWARFVGDRDPELVTGRAGRLLDRWGVAGLALFGNLLIGPTLTILSALVLGVDRTRFAVFFTIGTVVGFAVATVFWAAVL